MNERLKALLLLTCLLFSGSDTLAQNLEIYVSDAGNFSQGPWKILKFDQNGENPEVFIDDELGWPQDILFLENQNRVLISNLNSGRITRYNADTGAYIDNFATGIGGPTRMKIGPNGLLYVLQWGGNGRVWRYQLNGTMVDQFTNQGVSQSIGLDWDSSGNLYVSSYLDGSVSQFNTTGIEQLPFIAANLAGPTNIWFDTSGDLLVSDYDGDAVKRFSANGTFESNFITGLDQPEGVDFLPNGNILIGNGGTSSVKMYTPAGNYIEDLIPSQKGGLQTPNAIVVRSPGIEINAGLNDAWYNPDTPGQGFFFTVFPDIEQMFIAWFTFDVERPPQNTEAQLGEPGHRWLTGIGPYSGNTAEIALELTQGGVFDSAVPAVTQDADYGTLELTFHDCASATVVYDIPSADVSGSFDIQRIADDNVPLCEELQTP